MLTWVGYCKLWLRYFSFVNIFIFEFVQIFCFGTLSFSDIVPDLRNNIHCFKKIKQHKCKNNFEDYLMQKGS